MSIPSSASTSLAPLVLITTITITNQQGPLDSRNQHIAALPLVRQPSTAISQMVVMSS